MRILFLGDVFGARATQAVCEMLPKLKAKYGADVLIVNAENSHDNNGVSFSAAKNLLAAGADCLTGGNHSFKQREIYDFLDEEERILRPYNFNNRCPGRGVYNIDLGRAGLSVISMLGTIFMQDVVENPFSSVKKALAECRYKNIIIDFHAETTSEKAAFARFLDGKVSAVVGTHTHVQTADARIFGGGCGFITDVGMCGPYESILGVSSNIIINKFIDGMPQRFRPADGEIKLCGVFLEIDEKSGKTIEIKPFSV